MSTTAGLMDFWEQFVYGKLVQTPRGAIVPGSEHGCTGRSPGFPPELFARCHPSKLGLGERDPRRWALCPWKDIGGVVSGVEYVGTTPWVIAARVRERSEAGEGVEGRLYAEARYAAMPAQHYSPDALQRLSRELHAVPREGYDMSLPVIEVQAESVEHLLPDDWHQQVQLLLRGAMSGAPVNLQESERRPEDFLKVVTICLAAVPHTLRWRLPVGAGMITMEGTTAMAYGMAALGGLRVIGGVVRNEADYDLARGAAYVAWLAQVARGCKTVSELASVVAEELPQLASFDAVDPKELWAPAARAVAEIVSEKTLLVSVQRELASGVDAVDVSKFAHYRVEIVETLARQSSGPDSAAASAKLASTVRSGWHVAWRAAIARARGPERDRLDALAMLLGVNEIIRPEPLVVVTDVELRGNERDEAVARLVAAVDASSTGRAWVALLRPSSTAEAGWVVAWIDAARPRLVWLGIHDAIALTSPTSPLMDALSEHPLVTSARALLKGEQVSDSFVNDLLVAARPTDRTALDALIRVAEGKSAWRAYRLAERAHDRGIATTISTQEYAAQRGAPAYHALIQQLAKEIDDRDAEVGPLMLRDLLAKSSASAASPKGSRLRSSLGRMIGDPYATALLRLPAERALGRYGDVAADYCLRHLALDDELAERLIDEWNAFSGDAQQRALAVLRRWLATAKRDGRRAPVARAVRAMAGHGDGEPVPLRVEDRDAVSRTLVSLGVDPTVMWQSAVDEVSLSIVVQLWTGSSAMPLRADQLAQLMKSGLGAPERVAPLLKQVEQKGWTRAPGWRWVTGSASEADKGERDALERLKGEELLALILLRGLPVPVELAGKIAGISLDRVNREYTGKSKPKLTSAESANRLRLVLNLAERNREDALVIEVVRQAMQLCRDDGMYKKDLEQEFADEGSFFRRQLTNILRAKQPPVEVLRAAARALKRTPASLLADYWEGTKSRGGKR